MDAVASSHDCGEAKEAAERREKAVVHVTIPPASRPRCLLPGAAGEGGRTPKARREKEALRIRLL